MPRLALQGREKQDCDGEVHDKVTSYCKVNILIDTSDMRCLNGLQ